MTFRFEYLDKNDLEYALPALFRILHTNMSEIAPTGRSYDEDFEEWYSAVSPAMKKAARQIVLMYADSTPAGFFQYYTTDTSFMMEEIQIKPEYHGSGIFGELYTWLLKSLPDSITEVEAYSHKKNLKSQGILEHLGLARCGENKNGNSYFYKGDLGCLRERYARQS